MQSALTLPPKKRVLIVHGDDFGRSESITDGIVRAFREGILSSTSIVANSLAFARAVRSAHETPGLDIGIHLYLDEYPPTNAALCSRWRKRDGSLPGRAATISRLMVPGSITADEIEREWEAQIKKCLDAGIVPSHIDGHGHCHVHPALVHRVLRLGEKYHIPAIRLPQEPFHYSGTNATPARFIQKILLYACCVFARRVWQRHFRFANHFFGFMAGGQLQERELSFIVSRLPQGVNELMVHVGLRDADPYGLLYQWHSADFSTVTRWTKSNLENQFQLAIRSYPNAWA